MAKNWLVSLVTPAIGTGTDEDSKRPQFNDDYIFFRWDDMTGVVLVPAPNAYVIEATVTEAVKGAILADSNYVVLSADEITLPEII